MVALPRKHTTPPRGLNFGGCGIQLDIDKLTEGIAIWFYRGSFSTMADMLPGYIDVQRRAVIARLCEPRGRFQTFRGN